MSFPFTLTIDWLAFTLPSGSVEDTMHILGGDWTKSEVGFRGYPLSWLSAGAGRGVGKLGTGALRAPREVHVDLSACLDCRLVASRKGAHDHAMGLKGRGPSDTPGLRLG